MSANKARLAVELRRLQHGPLPDERPGGLGTVRFVARCPFGASEVLDKVVQVLKIVDEFALQLPDAQELSISQTLQNRMPSWFTSAFNPEPTAEENAKWYERWCAMSPEQREAEDTDARWSLESWLSWFEFENRFWYWWDAKALPEVDHILVAVEVDDWPFPWEALRWLFRAAGASSFEPEE